MTGTKNKAVSLGSTVSEVLGGFFDLDKRGFAPSICIPGDGTFFLALRFPSPHKEWAREHDGGYTYEFAGNVDGSIAEAIRRGWASVSYRIGGARFTAHRATGCMIPTGETP